MSLKTESIAKGHADTYREYNRMRLQDYDGSGRGDVATLPIWIIENGNGIFWKTSTKKQGTVFLFAPPRVFRMLRELKETLPFTKENGDC